MSNFMKVSSESAPRVELHEKLGLTGAEISINTIGAGDAAHGIAMAMATTPYQSMV